MAVERIKQLKDHLTGASGSGLRALEKKNPDDVVITMAIRTPMCKAKKGGLKDMRSDELLTAMFRAVVAKSNVNPAIIQDIHVGTVLTPGPTYEARTAALTAGIPQTTPVQVVNRFCSSGLMAVTGIANQIRGGQIEIGLAVGMESMSANPDHGAHKMSDEIMSHPIAKDCAMPMGWTSENVAQDFNISREDMDAFAAISFQRAEHAQKQGYFQSEIVPIEAPKISQDGTRTTTLISQDDGIRPGTTAANLARIRSAFPQWGKGQTTGGNASQVTDGAAAVLLMTRRKAEELGLKILAKYVTASVVGLEPRIMGIGPVYAIPVALKQAGIEVSDVDLFEINEAFASMLVYCVRKLGLDHSKVNVNGGAIALELERRKGKVLVTSMCCGTGMGAAAVFVRE
ncbi:thiolase [Sistotremastrum niveocremeum HHB9708]|uniref:Thiolase n=1 Tax=Sistotremastrum niveocremeum HHB9708 TaxID=1314777 RepID=A0A164X9H9_9AGAM|nr:thiolase [Sistotremastrum niveocremeum HHB9708]